MQIYTDHKNLIYFTTTKKLNQRQVRWSETLARYNFRIAYRKGTENARADALSRRSDFIGKVDRKETLLKEGENSLEYSGKIATVFEVIEDPTIEQRIKNAYTRDAGAQRALAEDNTTDFKPDDSGLIRFKGMVYLLERIRKQFVKELHEAPTSGHLGIEKTRNKVAECYYFPLITKMVKRVLKECEVCQKTKAVHRALYRLLMSPNTLKEP